MGSNRRYAEQIDRRMDERILQVAMRDHEPSTLTAVELALDIEPLTRTPRPRPVHAWVRYGDVPVRVEGEAVAWTQRAVAVRWHTPAGDEHRAWVWASAVDDR